MSGPCSLLLLWMLIFLLCSSCDGVAKEQTGVALPLVLPAEGNHGFILQKESLKVIEAVDTEIAFVTVIGPYRSGKSFLLNQLLGVSCNQGFGVGHERDAQTKGVWFWSLPMVQQINGRAVSIFFMDTEGLQSGGRVDAYDDRIFALGTLLSSVLIYNIPEAVKTIDLEKLSFAVTLADEFFDRVEAASSLGMPSLVWLIQRDFLKASAEDAVKKTLMLVPNPTKDEHVDRLNRIRSSLDVFREQKVFGLTQPHLDRTRLCEMSDVDLDPLYVKQRQECRSLVMSLSHSKSISGTPLSGPTMASYIHRVVEALNVGDIPSAVNVVDVFNRKHKDACYDAYRSIMGVVSLPVSETALEAFHEKAADTVREQFERKRFGKSDRLSDDMLAQMLQERRVANELASLSQCDKRYTHCVEVIEEAAFNVLPSLQRLDATFAQCHQAFITHCVGPSNVTFTERLIKHWHRRGEGVRAEFHARLCNNLAMIAFGVFVCARFWLVKPLLELVSGLVFLVLGFVPRMVGDAFYHHPYWITAVSIYESVVYNEYVDLGQHVKWVPGVLALVVAVSLFQRVMKRFRPKRERDRIPPV